MGWPVWIKVEIQVPEDQVAAVPGSLNRVLKENAYIHIQGTKLLDYEIDEKKY